MNAHRTVLVFAALLGSVLVSAPAKAAQRTFVASYGNDANACSLVAPCRSFGIAIAAADPNGEVIALDSAGYGTFTVTKSVSVVAPLGVYAGIAVTNTDAVVVNAPGIRVTLRNLTINGVPGATGAGITLLQGASLAVEDCSIANVAGAGIKSDVVSNVSVVRTTVRHNSRGIDMGAGTLTVVDSLAIDNGGLGIGVYSGGAATVTRTLAAFNIVGIGASSSIPGTSLSVTSSTITRHFGGVSVDAGTAVPTKVYVDIAGNTIAGNYAYGISFAGSSGASAGAIRGNVSGNQIVTNYFQGLLVDGTDTTARISGNFVFHNCCGIWQGSSGSGTPYSLGDNYVRDNPSGDIKNVSGDSPL